MTGPLLILLLSVTASGRSLLSPDNVLATIRVTPVIAGALLLGLVAAFVLISYLSTGKLRSRSRELRRAKVDIKRSRTFLDSAQRVARLGTWEFSLTRRELNWSEPLFMIFGIAPEDFDPDYESFISIVHPDDREMVREAASEAIKSNGFYEIEYRIVRPDGQIRTVKDEARVITNTRDQAVNLQGTIHDITGSKDAEEEVQRLEERALHSQKLENLAIMIGGIAHEFNNLLTGILGNTEIALRSLPENSPARESMLRVRESASSVERLTSQMLDYAEHESSEKASTNVSSLLTGMRRLLQAAVGRHIVVYFDLEDDLPAVLVDPYRLQQAVMNLAVSAGRAVMRTAQGSDVQGEVKIATCSREYGKQDLAYSIMPGAAQGRYIVLEVSDNGMPLTDDNLEYLSGNNGSITQDEEKLALQVVARIVRDSDGSILVERGRARGTTISVLLPATRVLEEVLHTQKDEEKTPEPVEEVSGKGKILLVDDEEVVREVGMQLLDILGFPSIAASDGSSALAMLREHVSEIGFVLLDMTMPGRTGKETLTLIRKIAPTVKVIICSGYSEEDVIKEFEGCDIAGILHKPYGSEDLAGLLFSLSRQDS